jgi:hypothetical protein
MHSKSVSLKGKSVPYSQSLFDVTVEGAMNENGLSLQTATVRM